MKENIVDKCRHLNVALKYLIINDKQMWWSLETSEEKGAVINCNVCFEKFYRRQYNGSLVDFVTIIYNHGIAHLEKRKLIVFI